MKRDQSALVCVVLLVGLGCGGGEPSWLSPCESLCTRTEECKPWLDDRHVAECIRVCKEENSFDGLTRGQEIHVSACLRDRSCRSIRANAAVSSCLAEATAP